MGVNNSQVAEAAPELIAAMTGAPVLIGTLIHNPTILIFDNQSSTSVVISINGISWKTFPAAEALVLDLRSAHGLAANYSFRIGTTFSGNGAANGSFSISYLYAKDI